MEEIPALRQRSGFGAKTRSRTTLRSKYHGEDEDEDEDDAIGFSVIDILRMILGILLFNVMVSYYFTGTYTYNYSGKLIQPHFLRFQLLGTLTNFTEQELALYSGKDSSTPIYVAINGTVWDVSANRNTYGPGGSYHFFAGTDCARAFATNCLNHLTYDVRDITPEEKRRLVAWIEWFDDKYFRVGIVEHEEPTGLPMTRTDCKGKYHT